MIICDRMSVRPASALVTRRRRKSNNETSSSKSQSDVSPLRTYTACGILGAWTKSNDSDGGYEEGNLENETTHDRQWNNEALWGNTLDTPNASLSPLLPEGKFSSKGAFFESMQKASGEKVLNRLRERQMSLTGGSPHPPQAIPPRTSLSTTPTPPRRYPRKLRPLPQYNEPPWSPPV